ncbi:MAG TPA: hypothetical protein VMU00_02375 [Steroidobacteraceae bacterium]|nr:hypothetical protein [Steroidobacteraceae bacterium]
MSIGRTIGCLAVALAVALAPAAYARDEALHLPIKEVTEDAGNKARLGSDVALYFGAQATPAIETALGTASTSKKTNAFNKGDAEACRWAMLSALLTLVSSARSRGADAVVDIRSNYQHVEFSSETEYECHAGNLMAGVAFTGRLVKLKK